VTPGHKGLFALGVGWLVALASVGNIVVYMRLKNHVPPSTAREQQRRQ
jgi:hypothetical protein